MNGRAEFGGQFPRGFSSFPPLVNSKALTKGMGSGCVQFKILVQGLCPGAGGLLDF